VRIGHALSALVCVAALSHPAAAGEEEWQLGIVPAYAVVDFDQRLPSGAGVSVYGVYGLTDWLSLRASAVVSWHPADANKDKMLPDGTITVIGAFGGIRYAFDLLRTVPYLDLSLGAIYADGAGDHGAEFSYQAALGFDHLQSPRWSWGLVVAYQGFISNFSKLPVYLYAGPTFTLRWD
jgi:hypothetical protein